MNSLWRTITLVLACTLVAEALGQDPPQVAPHLLKPLREISINPRTTAPVPQDHSSDVFQLQQPAAARPVSETHVHWEPANLHHQSLYFDQMMLERHGVTNSPHWQPLFSGAHFFAVAATMPYRLAVDRPHDIHYTYGQGRPGAPAPCLRQGLPWNPHGTALEGMAIAALFLMVP